MTELNDFRVVLNLNIQGQGTWDFLLEDCPMDTYKGLTGSVQPDFTEEQLKRLRNRHGWPNLKELTAIGKEVRHSLMTQPLETAFSACLEVSQKANRGMRLIVSMVGEEEGPAASGHIRLQELPLEALYFDKHNFLAPNPLTPISRSLKFAPDREPQRVLLPLRILVVVATPTDKPPSEMKDEKAIIEQALAPLTGKGGAVELEFCEPPTRSELTARLQKGFHILHFVGHGGFEEEGDDPSPRAHLCLEEPNRDSDPVDAKTLEILLRNSGVRLVVMTACASAKPTAADAEKADEKTIGPFDGVAQTLVAGLSGVNAVVAMQFDLESAAAVKFSETFSKTFYSQLLSSGRKLDEVVALCRKELISEMDAGHRAWVTPVVYWRCKDCRVFDIDPLTKQRDEKTAAERAWIEAVLKVHFDNLARVRNMPLKDQQAAAPLVAEWRQQVDELQRRIGQLLGETLRLYGGTAKPGAIIPCRLTFRLRTPAQIGDVLVCVKYPADKVSYSTVNVGANTRGNVPFVQNPAPGELTLLLPNASQGVQWTPDEYELALLTFQVQAGVTDPFLNLSLMEGKVQRDGADTPCETQSAVVFVS
jgi:hypothetical protein